MVKNSPARTRRSTPSTAATSPYDLYAETTSTSAGSLPVAGAGCDKRFLQDVEPAVELLVGRHQRHEDADDVAVEAAREQDQAALAGARRRRDGQVGGGLPGGGIAHEL